MKASFSWLKEYVSIELPAGDLAEALTMAGLEVEAVTDRYDFLDSVRVGKILAVHPHPNADKLKVCTVDIGTCSVPVVCGASNAREGMLSALAPAGSRLSDGTELEASVIRGQASEGMLCSEAELGIGEDRSGVIELPPGTAVGKPLREILSLSDPVFEINLTPNRPDCLSIVGIAREIAAIEKKPLRHPRLRLPEAVDEIPRYTSVTIEDPDRCPRYAARLLTDITVSESPFWLRDRLLSVGLRPINNIVDATNYVMMETGQPLHAFDFDRLAENRIVVRTAKEGEVFTTLDQKERRLRSSMLMICDGEKPVAIGGVMGGGNSEIMPETRRVLIESAYFNPASIRRTARELGLGTDASHRFERGVDPEGTLFALNRAAQIMAEIGGGTLIGGAIDEHPKKIVPTTIDLNTEQANRFLSTDLSREDMADLLTSIEFAVRKRGDRKLEVVPPSFRVDISRPEDLMEEIARLSGYNDIPATLPTISVGTKLPSIGLERKETIRQMMSGFGFTETINYSFMDKSACDRLRLPPGDPRRRMVEILNPLAEDQTVMRTSMVPALLQTVRRNIVQQVRTLRLFEIGKVYLSKGKDDLPEEFEMLAGLWTGARTPASWHVQPAGCDYFDLKGVVESLFSGLKISGWRFTRTPHPYMRPGYTADVRIEGASVGLIGEVHPEVLSGYDLKQAVYIFELNLDRIFPRIPDSRRVKPLSRFPATARDVTLIVGRKVESAAILDSIEQLNEELVEAVHLFSLFEGSPIPAGRKSVSFRITYRSTRETLQDETINHLHKAITDRLVEAFHAALPT